MPSPLPGMDPWVELPAVFPDFHDAMIAELRGALNAALPAPYFATIAQRIWIDDSARRVQPAANVVYPESYKARGNGAERSVEIDESETDSMVFTMPVEEVSETYLEIRASGEPGDELVTTIEILSYANKRPGDEGRSLYLKKQREMLAGKVNMVEIDLLRKGAHTTCVPRGRIEARGGPFDYHVVVHAFEQSDQFRVYARRIGRKLPLVAVPLLPGDGAVDIDLQSLVDRAYDTGRYERRVKYRVWTPDPALTPEQAAWVDELLKAKGI
jgi:hypothetical protein